MVSEVGEVSSESRCSSGETEKLIDKRPLSPVEQSKVATRVRCVIWREVELLA